MYFIPNRKEKTYQMFFLNEKILADFDVDGSNVSQKSWHKGCHFGSVGEQVNTEEKTRKVSVY